MTLVLPRVIFIAGRKRSGKDYVADLLVERASFHKWHIAAPYLAQFFRQRGIDYWTITPEVKAAYREEIQREATAARAKDPNVLLRWFEDDYTDWRMAGEPVTPLVVSGIRFVNEALYGIRKGYFIIKVETPDEERRERFLACGESLDLFDDPFEQEIDRLPCHLVVPGTMEPDFYLPAISAAYVALRNLGRQMKEAA